MHKAELCHSKSNYLLSTEEIRWNAYTLANVVDGYGGVKLWLPAVFSYIYMAYACHLFYTEYRHFVLKRLEYLIEGDPDTNPQTHYTIMIENVPSNLQSAPALKEFFEKLFPGKLQLFLFPILSWTKTMYLVWRSCLS